MVEEPVVEEPVVEEPVVEEEPVDAAEVERLRARAIRRAATIMEVVSDVKIFATITWLTGSNGGSVRRGDKGADSTSKHRKHVPSNSSNC